MSEFGRAKVFTVSLRWRTTVLWKPDIGERRAGTLIYMSIANATLQKEDKHLGQLHTSGCRPIQ